MKIYFNNGIHIIIDSIHIVCDPSFTSNKDIEYDDYISMRNKNKDKENKDFDDADLLILSHAHSDHTDRLHYFKDSKIPYICHPMTAMLKRRFLPNVTNRILVSENHTYEFETLKITALSAGHCGGSLMFRIEGREGVIGFTGDFNTYPSIAIDPARPFECDYLITEATFGKPSYSFPPRFKVYGEIRNFIVNQLNEGHRGILMFGQGLGKNQDIARLMNGYGKIKVPLNGSVQKLPINIIMGHYSYTQTEAFNKYYKPIKQCYEENDFVTLPVPSVILETMQKCSLEEINNLIHKYGMWHPNEKYDPPIAIMTGWGDEHIREILDRYENVGIFKISSHSGYDQLISFIEKINPKKIFTFHGFADEFAKDLRTRGYEAYCTHSEIYEE